MLSVDRGEFVIKARPLSIEPGGESRVFRYLLPRHADDPDADQPIQRYLSWRVDEPLQRLKTGVSDEHQVSIGGAA